jgi:putative sterol carrier protein
MSACLKAFFERTLPLTQQGFVKSARGLIRNNTRYPDQWHGKKLITIIVGAFKSLEGYQPANDTFQMIADGLALEVTGQLTRPESYLVDYPLSKPKTLKRIEAAFVQAGREAGSTGRVSPETTRAASLSLAVDGDHFRTYANVYWSQARELGSDGLIPAEVRVRVAKDVRILMREMARSLDPRAAARVRAVVEFEFTDQGLGYHLVIDRGACRLHEGPAGRSDLLIRCAAEVWAGLFTGQLDARAALLERRLTLRGDKSLFTRLGRYFPPPSA